jgi:uncharacterized membrane protein YphA (DoxX/SURF4 family)
MKRISYMAEKLLGLILFIGGLNGVLHMVGLAPLFPVNNKSELAVVLVETTYLFCFQKGAELLAGILLMVGFYRWFAVLMATPMVLGIFLYHVFENSERAAPGLVVFALYVIVLAGRTVEIGNLLKQK